MSKKQHNAQLRKKNSFDDFIFSFSLQCLLSLTWGCRLQLYLAKSRLNWGCRAVILSKATAEDIEVHVWVTNAAVTLLCPGTALLSYCPSWRAKFNQIQPCPSSRERGFLRAALMENSSTIHQQVLHRISGELLWPIQPPPSLSSGNHRLSWSRHRCLKKRQDDGKKHYTKPPHVSNEYTPQLSALLCIFYIFTYTRYFQTSLCLFKTPSETCLVKQIQCKYIYWMTLPCIVFKML